MVPNYHTVTVFNLFPSTNRSCEDTLSLYYPQQSPNNWKDGHHQSALKDADRLKNFRPENIFGSCTKQAVHSTGLLMHAQCVHHLLFKSQFCLYLLVFLFICFSSIWQAFYFVLCAVLCHETRTNKFLWLSFVCFHVYVVSHVRVRSQGRDRMTCLQ